MAFDFPTSPSEGQIFSPAGGPTYVFNTPTWKAVGSGQIAYVSDTPPASPANGALWYESDTGLLWVWFNDGNSSQWVQAGGQTGIPEAPSDGGDYVRVNGVWRKVRESFDLTGLTTKDVSVPAWGPRWARIVGNVFTSTVGVNVFLYMRCSHDGTTFLAGGTDYANGGFYHATGTLGFQPLTWANVAQLTLTYGANTVGHAARTECIMQLYRAGSVASFSAKWTGFTYNSDTNYYGITFNYNGCCTSTATNSLKALRFLSSGGAWGGSSSVTVEWLQ